MSGIIGFGSMGLSGSSGTGNKGSSVMKCNKEEKFKENYPFPKCKKNFKNYYGGKNYLERIFNVNDKYKVSVKSYFLEPDNFIEITIYINRKDNKKILFKEISFKDFVDNLKTMLINESKTNEHQTYTVIFIENLRKIGTNIFPRSFLGFTIFPYNTEIQFRFNYNHETKKFTDGYSTLSFGLIDPEKEGPFGSLRNQVCNSDYSLADICVDGEYLKVLMDVFKKDAKDANKNINKTYENIQKKSKNN